MSQCDYVKNGFSKYQPEIDSTLNRLRQEKVIERIQQLDHTVWQPEPTEITNRLGWLDIANRLIESIPDLKSFVESAKADGFEQVLLLGMGGSSLAPELFAKTYGADTEGLELRILDSTDPAMVLERQDWIQPEKALFIVSSKSGGTAETFSLFKYFYTWMQDQVGNGVGNHFVAITDPGSQLQKTAIDLKFFQTFINDANIGGRFSALSFFGLVPAALCSVKLTQLLQSAIDADWELATEIGIIMALTAQKGQDKLTFLLSDELQSFGDWAEQLIAESTGKNGNGILPVVGEELLSSNMYGKDRLFVHLKLKADSSKDADVKTLMDTGHPVITLALDHLYQLGEQFFMWELATAISGHLLKINPFDQPNVESAKIAAKKMISVYLDEGKLPEPEMEALSESSFTSFMNKAEAGDYLCVQAYIPMTPESIAQMHQIQGALQKRSGLAVTVGFGPRFLHSTGQLHKGDKGNGLFIQLTCDPDQDVLIPNQPGEAASDMSFHILKSAQAMGDYHALKNVNRRVVHYHLTGDAEQSLTQFLTLI